jgi:hypothetical protein
MSMNPEEWAKYPPFTKEYFDWVKYQHRESLWVDFRDNPNSVLDLQDTVDTYDYVEQSHRDIVHLIEEIERLNNGN